jgi:glycosyltransferase involved in cell wall biosynthesis
VGLDPDRYRAVVALPAPGPLADHLHGDGVEILVRPLAVIRRELMSPLGVGSLLARAVNDAGALGRLARRRAVALVHSNTSVVLGGAGAAAIAGVPHVWHVREIFARFGPAWPIYRSLLHGSSGALVCVSEATAGQFRPSDRPRVVHDGLAVEPVRASRSASREALGLEPSAPVIAVLGRISDWKGQDMLVRALAEPPLRERAALGLIAGEAWPGAPERTARVLELAHNLGVHERLRMVGFREDLETVLGAADVVAVPSTAPDPLPGAALEAGAAGCAVVASAHGGLPEIIRDGETGRLIAPGDPVALAAACAELLDDSAQRERLGAAAAHDIRERFSAERLLDAIQGLFDALIKR